jgi:predicted ribosome quality control (RQC) complex YloA/Tae2 family protein
MNFRELTTESGAKIILGRNENNNDDLMKKFKGKENTILHTVSPGSPFCVIESPIEPSKEDISTSGAVCAKYSQDWRNKKGDVKLDYFTGKDISKRFWMKKGTWKVKKAKTIKVKKKDIIRFEKSTKQ